PKVEYAREGFGLFEEMNERIDAQASEEIFKVWIDEQRLAAAARPAPPAATDPASAPASASQPRPPLAAGPRPPPALGSPRAAGPPPPPAPASPRPAGATPSGKVGRNDACPCGSGKKYKRCCGA